MAQVQEEIPVEKIGTSTGIAATQKYDAAQIDKLEGLEAVRKRPGMFIGDPDERGLHHLVYEVLDNSIDEHLAGFCTRIEVIIHVDGSISVRDNGRGIPVDVHPKWKMPAIELGTDESACRRKIRTRRIQVFWRVARRRCEMHKRALRMV